MEKETYTVHATVKNPQSGQRFIADTKKEAKQMAQEYADYIQTTEHANLYYKRASYTGKVFV